MAEGKNGVIVYADWIKKFESLEDDEAGRLIKHFFRYINDLNPEPPDRTTQLMFIDIEATLKRDLKAWEKRAERSRANGKNGGRPKETQSNPEEPKTTQQVIQEPRKPDSGNVSGNDTVTVSDSVNKESKLYEMFRRAASQRLTDDLLLVEVGKFVNKYPDPKNHSPGLVNAWCSRIELPKPKFVI